ncbi:MAG TPA: tRNA (adenosine(37)-N6)-threonylcarbamoyltransferase complex ATPase subunit type 1 TsaE [Bryobacterales bacterium]|jgi:tRNA threonylcarbamoyladenosine biosynthesis protein TsaE|nr:tRNA (adenosine(37)-N6)-threonylcarbamoyltransferase complex ATPase subunit type 1 TsaE [Bryobacterales bacterium]
MPETFFTHSEEETIAAGREIAKRLRPPALVLLIGELGAGKTTLAKGIVSGLGAAREEDVSSPTFTLIHEYGKDPKVFHIDLYRLDRPPELETLGLDDLWDQNAIVLIEWGEKFAAQLPREHLEIRLEYAGDDERRIAVAE